VGYPDDKDLLILIRQVKTKEAGFTRLVEKYQQKLYWYIRRILISHEDADDAIQETFLKAWNKLDQFRGDSELYTWLYRIATNEALALLRKKKLRFLLPVINISDHLSNSLENDAFFTSDENEKRFHKALLGLPEKQRLVFNLKYFEELKFGEISKITGVSVGALKASYHHAVKKIEKQIKTY
jgi:RNA polymerase sigma factor (sigma-70 family)